MADATHQHCVVMGEMADSCWTKYYLKDKKKIFINIVLLFSTFSSFLFFLVDFSHTKNANSDQKAPSEAIQSGFTIFANDTKTHL